MRKPSGTIKCFVLLLQIDRNLPCLPSGRSIERLSSLRCRTQIFSSASFRSLWPHSRKKSWSDKERRPNLPAPAFHKPDSFDHCKRRSDSTASLLAGGSSSSNNHTSMVSRPIPRPQHNPALSTRHERKKIAIKQSKTAPHFDQATLTLLRKLFCMQQTVEHGKKPTRGQGSVRPAKQAAAKAAIHPLLAP